MLHPNKKITRLEYALNLVEIARNNELRISQFLTEFLISQSSVADKINIQLINKVSKDVNQRFIQAGRYFNYLEAAPTNLIDDGNLETVDLLVGIYEPLLQKFTDTLKATEHLLSLYSELCRVSVEYDYRLFDYAFEKISCCSDSYSELKGLVEHLDIQAGHL